MLRTLKWLAATLWDFVCEFTHQATVAGSWPTKITRMIVLAVTVLVGFTADSKVHISLLADNSHVSSQFTVQLGWLIFLGVLLVWLVVAFTRTWVGFKRIRVDNALEHDPGRKYYRLTVTNLGLFESDIHAYAVAVANASGKVAVSQLPIELDWMHQRSGARPQMRSGVPRKIDVFRVQTLGWTGVNNDIWKCSLLFTGLNGIELGIGTVTSSDTSKIWIAVAIDNYEDERWFSIRAGDAPFQIGVAAEDPPFLPSPRPEVDLKKLISLLDYLPDRLRAIITGAIHGACQAARLPTKKNAPVLTSKAAKSSDMS